MIKTQKFGEVLTNLSFNFYSGVPCSFLKDLINYAINEQDFIMAANEGDALAICAGAHIGGRKTIFLCQNSGLANAVSSLTSLNFTFQIPVLGFVSLRGEEGLQDEPQHELMGQITSELLTTMRIKHQILSSNFEEAIAQLHYANTCIENNESFFFIVRKGTFDKVQLIEQKEQLHFEKEVNDEYKTPVIKRVLALSTVKRVAEKQNAIVLATTGVTGRELFELGDHNLQFYMVGSMGCISSIALGLALVQPNRRIIAIDGDGALMMRMGSLTTNAYYRPSNMYHLLLDNNLHESTGGQQTVANNVDFKMVASASGYLKVDSLATECELENSLINWCNNPKLTFGYMKIKSGVKKNLGRPTITPTQVKERLMKQIKEGE